MARRVETWEEWSDRMVLDHQIQFPARDVLACCKLAEESERGGRIKMVSENLNLNEEVAARLLAAFGNKRRNEQKTPGVVPTEYKEINNMMARVQGLRQREADLERELASVKAELVEYGPVVNAMNTVKMAVQKVKDASEVRR